MTRSAGPARLASAGRRSVSSSSRRFRSVAITRAAARTPGSARTRSVICMSATESTNASGRTRPRVTMTGSSSNRAASPWLRGRTPPSSRSRTTIRPRARRARPRPRRAAPPPGWRRRTAVIGSSSSPRHACSSHARPSGEAPRAAPARRLSVTRAAPSRPSEAPMRVHAAAKPARRSSPDGVSPGPSPASPRAARASDAASRRTAASHRSRAGGLAAPTKPGWRTSCSHAQRTGRNDSLAPSATSVARAVRTRSASSAGVSR